MQKVSAEIKEIDAELAAIDEKLNAIVAAVSHKAYQKQGLPALLDKLVDKGVFIDVKSAWDPAEIEKAGKAVWRL